MIPRSLRADTDHVDPPVLAFAGVSKSFHVGKRHVLALENVNLQVRAGCISGLIGPDGAGKTTLMRLAAGLLLPDEGEISVLGLDAVRQSLAVQAAIGYMPQRFGLYDDLSVAENLNLYADLQGVHKKERPTRYRELMRLTGLAPFTSRLAKRLSGGMKQKLGLACTLVRPPRFLLLDEPTVGVDPVSRRELWTIVERLVREEGMSVLLSTAYLDEAERCSEVFLIHEGHILGEGSPKTFSDQMQGRTHAVQVPGLPKRALQERLAGAPGVVDAVIYGDQVRLTLESASPPDLEALLPDMKGVSTRSVPPRFEDSFVALLRARTGPNGAPFRAGPSSAVPVASPQEEKDHGPGGRIRCNGLHEPVIQVRNVERRFGRFYAVKNVSFDVTCGEVFGLLGANGAGKSTTFRMLCGLLPASGGTLRVAGRDLRRAAPSARARIGYMSQKFSLYGKLSVEQNLLFFSSVYGLSGPDRLARVGEVMEQFGLVAERETTSGDLPLGYKQRLAMACALMHRPEILFLDEPTSGVDPLARREFWHHINGLAAEGVTVLVTTHFMEEAEYCDRLAIMAAGEILALGTPVEVKADVRSSELPEPTLEDAFIRLIESADESAGTA